MWSEMQIIKGTKEFKLNNSIVTLGKFDGMHLGHKCLLDEVLRQKIPGDTAVLFTFDVSPYEILGGRKMTYILDHHQKQEYCKNNGIDVLIEYPFDRETRDMEAVDFIENVIIGQLDAKKVIVGKDFSFGKNRSGNIELLKKMAVSYDVIAKEKVMFQGEEISSTYIRKCISSGKIEKANAMLGRAFSYDGIVVKGKQIGRSIGIPTINIIPKKDKMIPPFGVYMSDVVAEGEIYKGITNVGHNPTVSNDDSIKVETNLLEQSLNLYDKHVEVRLISFIRPEMRFANLTELKMQIGKDIENVKKRTKCSLTI